MREWTQCVRRLAKLLDEHLAAMKKGAADLAGFEDFGNTLDPQLAHVPAK